MISYGAGGILVRGGMERALYGKWNDRTVMGLELTSEYSAQISEL